MSTHTLSLTTAFGDVVASEQVAATELPAALGRFYDRAVERANSVVVLDGVMHSRNSFLEFVRYFRDCTARSIPPAPGLA